MRFPDVEISSDVQALAPSLRVFMLHAVGLLETRPRMGSENEKSLAVTRALQRKLTMENLPRQEPFAGWRELFAKMKLQPSSFRSSVEALTRRVVRDGALPLTGTAIVDVYNAVSVNWSVPMGAYDISRVLEKIDIRFGRSTDTFIPLGGKTEDFPIKNTVIVYAAADQVLCFGLNCRDSCLTSINDQTDEAVFFAEALDAKQANDALAALSSLSHTLQAAGALTSLPVKVRFKSSPDAGNGCSVVWEWDETVCGSAMI